uniref:Uncharacterized protein n=1 Tax=Grammatophora oceanica TaxID=210454 RepID=A0A7S1Y336_9STRA|mmetsp:Transcript_14540/g.21423  ORF Transcript_14540/g.21423 Transcript_14540/m.21423 type:complete len:116 (+) Transcript_14540:82-429(+)|eukprot:CAMPEP_0194028172 /NCGR_PEP_ID=MMETSP0009_2-20130614/2210_1 /TAXON_ID=210454 /ORGANISM="Grammatophora oceanica, Strain CCMP 410" /LENGTH=115 /DNA_ID=CAMNT_0038667485 /DNA_START=72 /DNA_END=419 /DNA_ORIENTATION=-
MSGGFLLFTKGFLLLASFLICSTEAFVVVGRGHNVGVALHMAEEDEEAGEPRTIDFMANPEIRDMFLETKALKKHMMLARAGKMEEFENGIKNPDPALKEANSKLEELMTAMMNE